MLAVLLLACASGGCVVGPDYYGKHTPIPDQWHQQLEDGEYVGSNEVGQWWTLFDDPTLVQLIDCAEKHNLNLYAAYTRICQARSQECIVESARKPTLGGSGGIQTSLQSPNSINLPFPGIVIPSVTIFNLGLDVGWEPDLFGRVQRQLEAAEANTSAQIEAYRDVLVTLYGDVAQTYVQVRTLQQQLLIACRNRELQRQSLELASKRVSGGVSPNVDLYQAESNLAATEAEIPRLELQLHQTMNRLSTLLGHYPGAIHCVLAEPGPIPGVPMALPQVIPCDMVRQRPDVRQAERRIAAAYANVGAAVADLFPSFRIGGNFALSAMQLNDLFEGDSFGFGVGPSFSWPIFQAGRIRCNIQQQQCAAEEAIVNYEQALLRASEEVENSIIGFNKNRIRAQALRRTVEAAGKSLESVLKLYRAGQSDYQNVLDTQRTLFQAENTLAIAEGQIVTDLIGFYRALGGGWDRNHHCPPRCVRLGCPDRCPPESIQVQCDSSESLRYFETGAADSQGEDADGSSDSGDGDGDAESGSAMEDESLEEFLDGLKELENRLEQTPPEKPTVELDLDSEGLDVNGDAASGGGDNRPSPTTPPDTDSLPAPRLNDAGAVNLPDPQSSKSPLPMLLPRIRNLRSVPVPEPPKKRVAFPSISDPATGFNRFQFPVE